MGASRAKLNLLCYLCVVAGQREVATRLLHSPLVGGYVVTPRLLAWSSQHAFCVSLMCI